jgi:hypothetical protein
MTRLSSPSTILLSITVFLMLAWSEAHTQTQADTLDILQKSAPKIFIDCGTCDQDYIRTEIPFVNYVRDRKQADVHVMITEMYTGSGGTEYTLTLMGQLRFDGVNDTLKYNANKSDTQDMTRKGLVGVLRKGLVRYVIHSPLAEYLNVAYTKPTAASKAVDEWDY